MTEFTYVLGDYVITVKLLGTYRSGTYGGQDYEVISSSDPIRGESKFEAGVGYFIALFNLHKEYGKILSSS